MQQGVFAERDDVTLVVEARADEQRVHIVRVDAQLETLHRLRGLAFGNAPALFLGTLRSITFLKTAREKMNDVTELSVKLLTSPPKC